MDVPLFPVAGQSGGEAGLIEQPACSIGWGGRSEKVPVGERTMNKSDLADQVADRIGVSRAAAGAAVDAVFDAVRDALTKGEEVRIIGFGVFGTRNRPARTGRNPSTGASVEIRASTVPTFRPGKPLRDAVKASAGRS